VLFLLFLAFFAGSCISPPYLQFLLMQHVPTVLAAFLLAYLSNRFVISRLSFTSIIVFLCLHTLGARYLHSYVPYDAWSQQLFGFSLSETFGWERNHSDRVVHFSYGLLLAVPIQERRTTLPEVVSGDVVCAGDRIHHRHECQLRNDRMVDRRRLRAGLIRTIPRPAR
jgi:uncharacterized membrane protein YjdF